jgi:hypothetical protein
MRIKVVGRCSPECGVTVHGEVESSSREIVHRFEFPKGSEGLVSSRPTEVEGFHLATFGPDEREWKIECPLCRAKILVARFQS